MKVISLNTWEGKILEPLKSFIQKYSKEVDVFCFQEVLKEDENNLFDLIQKILPDFDGYFNEQVHGVGLATFVKKTIEVKKVDTFCILSSEETKKQNGVLYHYPRIVQIISLKNIDVNIFNFHGIPGAMKEDTIVRKLQSERLQRILDNYTGNKILVGDFNLSPNTNAIGVLENMLNNLMKNSDAKTTRTKLYEKRDILPFADYIFVSPNLKINSFNVLPDEVSDHLPLIVDFIQPIVL